MGLGALGMPEIALIMFIVLLLFGGKRMAEMGKGMGEGINSFRKGLLGRSDEKEQ